MNLFIKKPLDHLLAESEGAGEKGSGLKRTLSATSLVALGIGAIIGAGIGALQRRHCLYQGRGGNCVYHRRLLLH